MKAMSGRLEGWIKSDDDKDLAFGDNDSSIWKKILRATRAEESSYPTRGVIIEDLF